MKDLELLYSLIKLENETASPSSVFSLILFQSETKRKFPDISPYFLLQVY